MTVDETSAKIARLERRLARERHARHEAERIAETTTRELYENVQRLERQKSELEETRARLLDLSMPILHLWQQVLAVPVIGSFDAHRAELLSQALLAELAHSDAHYVILDIKGISTVDSTSAHHLLQIAQSAQLMGAHTFVSGMRPEIAITATTLGFEWGRITTCQSLRDAVERILGTQPAPKRARSPRDRTRT